MKRKLSALFRQYATALRKHLEQGPQASLQPARGLGRKAVGLGLDTLDVARIHEEAVATLGTSGSRDGNHHAAEIFFTEAITPIEKTHRAALDTDGHSNHANQTLDRRIVNLTASNRALKQNIARRKAIEEALRKSDRHSKKLLEESRRLQKHLQHLTHQMMSALEDKRKKISHELQDEIAQTLLGINVRLLTLKKEAVLNASGFKKDIASTQRLVEESVESINRFACELNIHQEA